MTNSARKYQKHHSQVQWLRNTEVAGKPAIFFLRMLMEGRPIEPHMPKTEHKRIALASDLSELLQLGVNIPGTQKYRKLYIPSDIVCEMALLFWPSVHSLGSLSTRTFIDSTLLLSMIGEWLD
jgi:hypothetical protein